MTNTGRPGQRRPPAENDPRNPRAAAPQQRFAQPAPPNNGYPQAPYPEQPAQTYDPQSGYHYPQQGQFPQQGQYPQAAPGRPAVRQDPITQPGSAAYPATQPPFAQPAPAPQRGFPAQEPAAPAQASFRQPAAPSFPGPSEPRTAPPSYDQWGMPAPQQDARGYDLGTYMPAASGQGAYGNDPLQPQAEWVHAAQAPYGDANVNFHQAHHSGALEPTHGHEEGGDYEYEEPRRGSWMLRIAGAIVVAVCLGYGLAQGYKMLLGSPSDPTTPVVKNDSAPAKSVPTDPGGKQFAHSDSKVMGRLGDGAPGSDETGSAPAAADTDATGARKVQTVVVGRDGAIVPPSAPAAPEAPAATAPPASPPGESVAVPGLTVIDGFGGRYPGNSVTTAAVPPQKPEAAPASKPAATPPASKHAKAKAATPPPPPPAAEADAAAGVEETPAPVAKPPAAPKKQVTAANPAAAPAVSASAGANGYVVVLASIPASGSSRLDALKRFADMQQKYGTVLANKTPEVQEANLGDKGMFNRLLVGPPGSRASATALCTELKAAGYKDCWVAAY
jgi:sporulation related protein